jgi:transcription-repair coupling factor (superfamily II helicase)
VHEDHGIARFERFITREIAGVVREYLELRSPAPTSSRSRPSASTACTRYVGGHAAGAVRARRARLGCDEAQSEEGAEEIARELLRLYAARETIRASRVRPGHAVADRDGERLPVHETPDQLVAIEDAKRDLERARPMDRLVVGDVGYGKTEVALRAAFKAVQDGKQVAVLVPTTVLAQQHFETFSERLATFPVRVAMLSRFRTPPEQREVVAQLETGEVDIVIGTHRLLQKDVRFPRSRPPGDRRRATASA